MKDRLTKIKKMQWALAAEGVFGDVNITLAYKLVRLESYPSGKPIVEMYGTTERKLFMADYERWAATKAPPCNCGCAPDHAPGCDHDYFIEDSWNDAASDWHFEHEVDTEATNECQPGPGCDDCENCEHGAGLVEDDDADWRREIAMEAGMLHGVDGYNEVMGY